MPFLHGSGTQVLLDSKNISAYLNALDFSAEVELADTTTFSKTWKTAIPGLIDSSVDSAGFYDPTFEDIRMLLTTTPDSVLSWSPGQAPIFGSPTRMLGVRESTYKESSPVGGVVAFNWTAKGQDTTGIGHNFHPLAAETTTGFSAYLDGGAATLLGAVAHLHISAVSGTGSPTLTVKFRDATSGAGAGLADIASGSFTAATAIGAQRLVIPGTIRQFVRVDWTISGTTPSFTFAVAFARKQ